MLLRHGFGFESLLITNGKRDVTRCRALVPSNFAYVDAKIEASLVAYRTRQTKHAKNNDQNSHPKLKKHVHGCHFTKVKWKQVDTAQANCAGNNVTIRRGAKHQDAGDVVRWTKFWFLSQASENHPSAPKGPGKSSAWPSWAQKASAYTIENKTILALWPPLPFGLFRSISNETNLWKSNQKKKNQSGNENNRNMQLKTDPVSSCGL